MGAAEVRRNLKSAHSRPTAILTSRGDSWLCASEPANELAKRPRGWQAASASAELHVRLVELVVVIEHALAPQRRNTRQYTEVAPLEHATAAAAAPAGFLGGV